MSNRRDNKGFTKLAPTEELALSEMAAMNSGSELELLDLTSTEHRRGGVWMQLIGTQLVPATDVFRVR